jgi:hypothetical protein
LDDAKAERMEAAILRQARPILAVKLQSAGLIDYAQGRWEGIAPPVIDGKRAVALRKLIDLS